MKCPRFTKMMEGCLECKKVENHWPRRAASSAPRSGPILGISLKDFDVGSDHTKGWPSRKWGQVDQGRSATSCLWKEGWWCSLGPWQVCEAGHPREEAVVLGGQRWSWFLAVWVLYYYIFPVEPTCYVQILQVCLHQPVTPHALASEQEWKCLQPSTGIL